MGRVSKRKKGIEQNLSAPTTVYNVGIYARFSSEQDEKKNESIENQLEIGKKFVEDFNQKSTTQSMYIVEYYTDLGKTGSNFERNGFLKLLQDIRLGEINCVIVKDLSRFGRNYLEAGNYIEKIFPFLGVRFIAIADDFDTGKADYTKKQIAVEIKNLVNDMYAKDFSKKAKLQLQQRREAGSYVGGPAPYGYIAEWNGQNRILVPDKNTTSIVQFIYDKFIETESYAEVTKLLNQEKINPPKIYKETKEVFWLNMQGYKGWDKSSVQKILSNEIYIGNLVQGKTSIYGRNEVNRVKNKREDWVIRENTHQALIKHNIFNRVLEIQEKKKQKADTYIRKSQDCPLDEKIFDNILFCGVCGKKLTRDSTIVCDKNGKKTRRYAYFCLNSVQNKIDVCVEKNRITQGELSDILLSLFRMEFAIFLNKPNKYLNFGEQIILESEKNAQKKLKEIETKIKKINEEEREKYIAYRMGIVTQSEYIDYKVKQEEYLKELREKIEIQKKEVQKLEKSSQNYRKIIKELLKLKSAKELTKDMIEAFVSKIYIYPQKRVEVIFSFSAEEFKIRL